ncbi:MAG: hypothetical protein BGO12_18895 [Verrucomicrobia bacterium 61-8]|nr:VWA domain-containing protein [Verrucomicrobiota bacterium]OJV00037.1 MAG: hypothetical protein BGO12_18895 [Verrucomicrobia bacterium 61-8]
MSLEILRPGWFSFLLLLPLVWWVHARSIAPLRGRRRLATVLIRSVLVVLLVSALVEPRWVRSSDREEVMLLVDESRSVDGKAVEAAEKFAREANFAGADVVWMGFAGGGRIFRGIEELKKADPTDMRPAETRLDTALSLAAANFRPGRVKTVVLFSDGVATGGDDRLGGILKEQAVRVHAVPVAPPDRPEVLVREVAAPASVRANEPLQITATVQTNRPGPADIDLFRNGVRIATRKVELKNGPNDVRFEDRAGNEKLLHYEVGVRSAQDTIAENNQMGAAVVSEGAARVLLVTDRPESARYLEWALRQEGIELSVRPGQGMPTQMSDIQNYDTIIIDNVPASDLSREQMSLLHSYVRDFGGGLLMLGGDQAYGLGGYYRTPVEDVLPVSCDFQREEEAPSLALALVIDRSGSMSGDKIEMAKAAAKASAELLGPKDYVSVIAFDSECYPVVPLQSAGNSSVATEIASIQSAGGTNMAPAMEEALRQLSGSSAKLKHVILLTDGVSQEGPFYELTSQMVQGGITVSTVAVGEGSDTELLSQIAQWGGGRYYETNDPSTVPQIFTKETMTASKSAIQEFPFLAKPVRAVDFLEGVPWDQTPFLLGYVRTKPKPTSETWLVTERGDPLLTTWRYGLGTTAAFTSDARNRWAVEWLRWNGFGKFWAQLLRRLSRPESLGLSEVAVKEKDGMVGVVIDALDPVEGFPAGLTGSIRLAGPDGKAQEIQLEKTLPGRWVAEFAAPQKGIYSAQVLLTREGQPADSRFFTFSRGFSKEFLFDPPDRDFLSCLAGETGGVVDPDPKTVFTKKDRKASLEEELWPLLALLALAGFVLDVAARRWPER